MIEIRINSEIRSVKADVAVGLSLYEIGFCAGGALCAAAVGAAAYFKLHFPIIVTAYCATAIVIPFAFMGLFRWHEMTGIQILRTVFRSMTEPSVTTYGGRNEWYVLLKELQQRKRKEEKKGARKDAIRHFKGRFQRKKKETT